MATAPSITTMQSLMLSRCGGLQPQVEGSSRRVLCGLVALPISPAESCGCVGNSPGGGAGGRPDTLAVRLAQSAVLVHSVIVFAPLGVFATHQGT
jgi:hypothetical protein